MSVCVANDVHDRSSWPSNGGKERQMKTRYTLFALAALLVAVTATAQPFSPAGPQAMTRQAEIAKYLALTPEQTAAWQQIGQDEATAIKPLVTNVRDLEAQLKTALQATTPDPLATGKLVVSIHSVRQQIRTANEAAKAKRTAVLTTEQKVKFDAFQAALQFVRPGRAGARNMGRMRG
jgi:Spy/CpxP family protein refolding chaperone